MAWILVRFHWRCSHAAGCVCVSALCFLEGVLKKSKCKLKVNVIHCIALWLSSELQVLYSSLFTVLNCTNAIPE